MSYPVFATGDVLNASDMNAVGLWLVKTQTVGSGVSSVTVTGAFSADYDNYKIVYSAGVASAPVGISLKLGASTTGYYIGGQYVVYTTGAVATFVSNNGAAWSFVGEASTGMTAINCDICSPFLSKFTTIWGAYSGTVGGSVSGYHGVATSYSDFTLSTSGATLTGGTIRVYGYRN
jgi:hypothetical protein